MTLPDEWWTTDMEDEPCSACGARPSKSMGHGRYTCKGCYEASWCPKCRFQLSPNHVCPTPEEAARRKEQYAMLMFATDPDAAVQEIQRLRREVATLTACLAEIQAQVGWWNGAARVRAIVGKFLSKGVSR